MVVLVIAVLATVFVVYTHKKKSLAYPLWFNNRGMVGALNSHLTPEYVASQIGESALQDEAVFLRTNWKFDDDIVKAIDMPRSLATPNKDAWGSLYYLVCDFNNDGKVPNPELLTVPPKPGVTRKELPRRMVLFSAGPDGDPATWDDNQPPSLSP